MQSGSKSGPMLPRHPGHSFGIHWLLESNSFSTFCSRSSTLVFSRVSLSTTQFSSIFCFDPAVIGGEVSLVFLPRNCRYNSQGWPIEVPTVFREHSASGIADSRAEIEDFPSNINPTLFPLPHSLSTRHARVSRAPARRLPDEQKGSEEKRSFTRLPSQVARATCTRTM